MSQIYARDVDEFFSVWLLVPQHKYCNVLFIVENVLICAHLPMQSWIKSNQKWLFPGTVFRLIRNVKITVFLEGW